MLEVTRLAGHGISPDGVDLVDAHLAGGAFDRTLSGFVVLASGTDDVALYNLREGGRVWTNVIDKVPGIPKGIWVSEVQPSRFDEGAVYATFTVKNRPR